MIDEDENIDLSEFTYLEFLAFFFDRPELEFMAAQNLIRKAGCYFEVGHPSRVIEYLTEMCIHFSDIARTYSPQQIEQGLWAMFGGTIDCAQYLFDTKVDIAARVGCVESMYTVFHDVYAGYSGDPRETFYWMWWDMILYTRGLRKQPGEYRKGYVALTADEERIIDAIYATLCRILDIEHRGCQWSAIHGMGHLYHPEMQVRTQAYIERYRDQLSEDDLLWIKAARQNRIV